MIPKIKELADIAETLSRNNLQDYLKEANIIFYTTPEMIQKINEDLYYRNGQEGEFEANPDELEISIQGIKFIYKTE